MKNITEKIRHIKSLRPVNITIDIDKYVAANTFNTMHSIENYIMKTITDVLDNNDFINKIIANGNIGSIIQEHGSLIDSLVDNKNLQPKSKSYVICKVNNIDCYIDPDTRWDNNNILLNHNDYNMVIINIIDQNGYVK